MINTIPQNLTQYFENINTVSPSEYTRLHNGCLYSKVVVDALNNLAKRENVYLTYPSGEMAILGTVIHRMFENSPFQNKEDFERQWVETYQKHIKIRSEHFPHLPKLSINYDKMHKVWKVVEQLFPTPQNNQNTARLINQPTNNSLEKEYRCEIKGILKGTIDRVEINNNEATVVDYKTGKILDENDQIKQDYIDQLHLYALLFENERPDIHVTELAIIDSEGNRNPVNRNNQVDYIGQAQTIIQTINNAIANRDFDALKNPSNENCKYCNGRHLCQSYWTLQDRDNNLLQGIIKEKNRNLIVLQSGSIITGIDKIRHLDNDDLNVGDKVVMLNLFYQENSGNYCVTDNTVVYKFEQ